MSKRERCGKSNPTSFSLRRLSKITTIPIPAIGEGGWIRTTELSWADLTNLLPLATSRNPSTFTQHHNATPQKVRSHYIYRAPKLQALAGIFFLILIIILVRSKRETETCSQFFFVNGSSISIWRSGTFRICYTTSNTITRQILDTQFRCSRAVLFEEIQTQLKIRFFHFQLRLK